MFRENQREGKPGAEAVRRPGKIGGEGKSMRTRAGQVAVRAIGIVVGMTRFIVGMLVIAVSGNVGFQVGRTWIFGKGPHLKPQEEAEE